MRLSTRRQFLKGVAATAGAAALMTQRCARYGEMPDAAAQEPAQDQNRYLPLMCKQIDPPRVVHMWAPSATHWDFGDGYYGDAVDQDVVNEMMERGLSALTGTESHVVAWATLLPAYEAGQKIAVKVNLNNARQCDDTDNAIDALMETVNALIRSMVNAGIAEEDVWVYDALRCMPARFYGRRLFKQARYFDSAGCADEIATFGQEDGSLLVAFTNPAMQTQRHLTDLLYRVTYLINMPILKLHGTHPVTLGFKNHFGSLSNLGGAGDDNPHPYIKPTDSRYTAASSPLVDINANPNIKSKTVLTIGDGLFSTTRAGGTPTPWEHFGNQSPNSLLLSRDPVAIDCVMCDLLDAEWGVADAAYDYLKLANACGLGMWERGDPFGRGYNNIDYIRVDM